MSDKILCMSGGVDSTCAFYLTDPPKTIFFETGGYSLLEKEAVLHFAPDTIIDSSLNFDNIPVDSSAYILYRNLLIAARAAAYLPNGGEVIIAGLKDDLVSDKNPEAFDMMTNVLNRLDSRKIKVTSPFWGFTKAEVVKKLHFWFPDTARDILLQTFSCYAPVNGKECLSCPACFRKWNALWDSGIKTRFKNKDLMMEYCKSAEKKKYIPERCTSIIDSVFSYVQWESHSEFKTYCFDIDGVLCEETEGHDYKNRTPTAMIGVVNGLYAEGHWIILHTSRWQEDFAKTCAWMREHNVLFHEIHFNKPKADFYIDDKSISITEVTSHE